MIRPIYLIVGGYALVMAMASSRAETFDEMWNRRIVEPLAESHQWSIRVKTIEIKPEPKKAVQEEHHHRHRHHR